MWAFDLIELNGDDLRRDPLAVREATLERINPNTCALLGPSSGLRHQLTQPRSKSCVSGSNRKNLGNFVEVSSPRRIFRRGRTLYP
jgi:hypothetical protein